MCIRDRALIRHLAPNIDEAAVLRAFANARLLGRFWKVEEDVYADIAHNAEKIEALSGEIRKQFGERGKILVVGISGQRISTKVFRALADIAHTIIVTSASFKGQDPARVREEVKGIVGDIPAVSYTHLDVYKRQRWRCAPNTRSRTSSVRRWMPSAGRR